MTITHTDSPRKLVCDEVAIHRRVKQTLIFCKVITATDALVAPWPSNVYCH